MMMSAEMSVIDCVDKRVGGCMIRGWLWMMMSAEMSVIDCFDKRMVA